MGDQSDIIVYSLKTCISFSYISGSLDKSKNHLCQDCPTMICEPWTAHEGLIYSPWVLSCVISRPPPFQLLLLPDPLGSLFLLWLVLPVPTQLMEDAWWQEHRETTWQQGSLHGAGGHGGRGWGSTHDSKGLRGRVWG